MIHRHVAGWLYGFQWFRLLLVFVVQHPITPGWLVNFIWLETPFGFALRDAMLRAGQYELAAEATRCLERGTISGNVRGSGGG